MSEPLDPEEAELARAEREALEHEDELAVLQTEPHERMVEGLLRAAHPPETDLRARGADAWPALASLGPDCHAAFTTRDDGATDVRHRRQDGSWGPTTRLPAPPRAREGEAA